MNLDRYIHSVERNICLYVFVTKYYILPEIFVIKTPQNFPRNPVIVISNCTRTIRKLQAIVVVNLGQPLHGILFHKKLRNDKFINNSIQSKTGYIERKQQSEIGKGDVYRFIPETFSNKLYCFNWNRSQGATCHITQNRNNLFTNVFVIVQQPVKQGS